MPDSTPINKDILIAFYSWGGTTRRAAEEIREAVGGALFEIKPKHPYPADYSECVAAARKECPAGFKPELEAMPAGLASCGTLFIGSPNWCSTIAPPVLSFLAAADLAGKTVVPFFTNGGGGMQACERAVRAACPKSKVLAARTCGEDGIGALARELATELKSAR